MSDRQTIYAAFGVTAHDIARNHEGLLAESQARRLRRSGLNNIILAFVGGAVLAGLVYLGANKPLKPVQWILSSGLFLALLAVGVHYARKMIRVAAVGRVDKVSGTVEIASHGKDGWWVHVAGREFRSPTQPWKIRNGAAYHVFVIQGADQIVAMEPDGWDA